MMYDATGFQVMTMEKGLPVNVGAFCFLLGFSISIANDIVTSLSDGSRSITWWGSVAKATLLGSLFGTIGVIAGEQVIADLWQK